MEKCISSSFLINITHHFHYNIVITIIFHISHPILIAATSTITLILTSLSLFLNKLFSTSHLMMSMHDEVHHYHVKIYIKPCLSNVTCQKQVWYSILIWDGSTESQYAIKLGAIILPLQNTGGLNHIQASITICFFTHINSFNS